jgi:hypothetical protein
MRDSTQNLTSSNSSVQSLGTFTQQQQQQQQARSSATSLSSNNKGVEWQKGSSSGMSLAESMKQQQQQQSALPKHFAERGDRSMDFTTTSAVAYGSGGANYNGWDAENKGPALHASSSNNPLNYHSPGAGGGTSTNLLTGLRASAVATARKASGQRVPFATDSTGAHFEVGFVTSGILHFRDPFNAQTYRSLIFMFFFSKTVHSATAREATPRAE